MSEIPASPQSDPERLEEGLRRLRELGYLQTPAESYVAARVGGAGGRRGSAAAAGIWIGGGGGVLVALLLVLSALVAEPELLDRPRSLVWLWLDVTVLMVVLGATGVGLTALALLAPSDAKRIEIRRLERALVWLPGLIGALYLADRLGRATLVDLSGTEWIVTGAVVAAVAGLVGAAGSWSLAGALALARLQGKGVFQPPRLRRWERPLPLVVFSLVAFVLLAIGPYRGLEPLPNLGEIAVTRAAEGERLLLIAVDGVRRPVIWPGPTALEAERARGATDADHPAAYWNELATGFGPEEHGVRSASAAGPRGFDHGLGDLSDDPVLDLLMRHLLPGVGLGRTVAADRRDLRRPPVWEIVAASGRPTRVVNWWATYPAVERQDLEVVSDRHFLRLYDGRGEGLGLVWPLGLDVEDVDAWRADLVRSRERIPGFERGLAWILGTADASGLREVWDLATAADLYHVARALDAPPEVGFVALHLNGLDMVRRAIEREGLEPTTVAPLLAAQESYVHDLLRLLLDGWSGEVAAVLRDASVPVVWATGPTPMPERAVAWTPWLLWSMGVPPPRDMELPAVLRGAPLPSDRPATYGAADPPEHPEGRSGDDLERLRSLGYIDG